MSLQKGGNLDTEAETCTQGGGQGHVNLKAEIRVMHLQAKKCQGLPTNPQNMGNRNGILSSQLL